MAGAAIFRHGVAKSDVARGERAPLEHFLRRMLFVKATTKKNKILGCSDAA